jgi:hypothetical protein
MHRNSAGTSRVEKPIKQGDFGEKRSISECRKVSVAPMMDWTDKDFPQNEFKRLHALKNDRSLYVAARKSLSAKPTALADQRAVHES